MGRRQREHNFAIPCPDPRPCYWEKVILQPKEAIAIVDDDHLGTEIAEDVATGQADRVNRGIETHLQVQGLNQQLLLYIHV